MRVCENCHENNVMNSSLKFVNRVSHILTKKFSYNDICLSCEPKLLEKHKEEIFNLENPRHRYYTNKLETIGQNKKCANLSCNKTIYLQGREYCSKECHRLALRPRWSRKYTNMGNNSIRIKATKDGITNIYSTITLCAKALKTCNSNILHCLYKYKGRVKAKGYTIEFDE